VGRAVVDEELNFLFESIYSQRHSQHYDDITVGCIFQVVDGWDRATRIGFLDDYGTTPIATSLFSNLEEIDFDWFLGIAVMLRVQELYHQYVRDLEN